MDASTRLRLESAATALDVKMSARERKPNIYRLGHYLDAIIDIEDEVNMGADLETAIHRHAVYGLADVLLAAIRG